MEAIAGGPWGGAQALSSVWVARGRGLQSREGRWAAGVQGPLCPCPALEMPELDLDSQLPLVRHLPHIAVLRDELPHRFQDDYVGAEEEEAEARGEHTLAEKFGEKWAQPCGFWSPGRQPVPPRARLLLTLQSWA